MHRVVVVGGGFGGLQAVRGLRRAPVEVTLIDRRNFHLFQPLTYQVATGALSPGEIAYPLRAIFKRDRNVRVLLAEVADFDLDARELHLRSVSAVRAPERLGYDTLIVAGGSHYSYFGHEDWRMHAAEVKSLESALAVRSRLLSPRSKPPRPSRTQRHARRGSRSPSSAPVPPASRWRARSPSSARDTLRRDFRSIDPRRARILLVEVADRVLNELPALAVGEAVALTAAPRRNDPHGPHRDRGRRAGARGRRRRGAHPQPSGRLGCRGHRVRPRRQPRRAHWRRA